MIDTSALEIGSIVQNSTIARDYPKAATCGSDHFQVIKINRAAPHRPIFEMVAVSQQSGFRGHVWQPCYEAETFQPDHLTLISSELVR